MTKIGNKDISLAYNFLNLPGGKGAGDNTGVTTPAWTYSVNGAKLKYENRDYVDGIEYKDGDLYCIHHAKGRIFPKEQTAAEIASNAPLEWEHNFYLRDHLGNTRIVLDESGFPIQENNYYPFGMNMKNIDAVPDDEDRDSKYTYNGKEMNTDLGWLDYGARFYDPSVARFTSVDPLAGNFTSQSSFQYAYNNPLRFIDPDGRSADDVIVGKEDQAFVLENFHARTSARFTFDDNNRLIRDDSVEQSSDAFSDKIDQAIGADGDIIIKQEQFVTKTFEDGTTYDFSIDLENGGGKTSVGVKLVNGEQVGVATIELTGNGNPNVKDTEGNSLSQTSADILLHEFVGHALPAIGFTGTGNAIDNENIVRDKLGLKQRAKDPDHVE